jgi:hypothetical protein
VALFRYSVIADLTQLEPHHRGYYKLLQDKAEREYTIPGTLRRRVAAVTMRDWLSAYRRGGFDALLPVHGPTQAVRAPSPSRSSTRFASSKTTMPG